MADVHPRPCSACPYRQDCPSGVWAADEYQKLIEYDKETSEQPMAVFYAMMGIVKAPYAGGGLIPMTSIIFWLCGLH